jgi:group I intron endonuclease
MRIKKSGVYQIVNEINGKFYIGSSVDIVNRWAAHRHTFKNEPKYNSRIISAVRKYGIEHFTFIVLEECLPIKEIILACEQYYIDNMLPQYNILPKAGSNLGFKQPPSFYEKRNGKEPWNKGVPMSEEQKQILLDGHAKWIENGGEPWNKNTSGLMPEPWNKGIQMTDKMKQKLSDSHKGLEPWNKGLPVSDVERQRLLEISAITHTPEHQQKMTEAARITNTGKPRSEDTKRKISEGNIGKDMSMLRGIPRTEDVRLKVSEGIRNSEVFQQSVKARVGKSTKKSSHGNYGITWRNDSNKWIVKIKNKKYGSFKTIDEAIVKRDAMLINIIT